MKWFGLRIKKAIKIVKDYLKFKNKIVTTSNLYKILSSASTIKEPL